LLSKSPFQVTTVLQKEVERTRSLMGLLNDFAG